MSTFSPATLRCACGHEHAVEVADSLHVSARPDLRAAILAGEFHRFACPACRRASTVEKLVAYTDFPRRQWFTVVPPVNLARRSEWVAYAERSFRAVFLERAAPIVRTWAPSFTRRVIFGLASLREKLVAFDAGLDDRTLEHLKLDLIADGRLGYTPDGYFHLSEVRGDQLVLEWGLPGDRATQELVVPRSEYDVRHASPDLARATALLTGPVVDLRVLHVPELAPEVNA